MPEGTGASNGVAKHARGRQKHLAPALAGRIGGFGGRTALSGQPRLEAVWVLGDEDQPHVCVLIPAEFRTPSFEHTRPSGSKNLSSQPPWDQVPLAVEIR